MSRDAVGRMGHSENLRVRRPVDKADEALVLAAMPRAVVDANLDAYIERSQRLLAWFGTAPVPPGEDTPQ